MEPPRRGPAEGLASGLHVVAQAAVEVEDRPEQLFGGGKGVRTQAFEGQVAELVDDEELRLREEAEFWVERPSSSAFDSASPFARKRPVASSRTSFGSIDGWNRKSKSSMIGPRKI